MTFLLSRFEGQIPVGSIVGNETEVNGVTPAIIGSILLLNTMILGFSFPGPWDSESFTLGIIGMTGLGFWYVSWYRFTFNRKGLIPWLDNWKILSNHQNRFWPLEYSQSFYLWNAESSAEYLKIQQVGIATNGLLISLSGIYSMLALGPLADSIGDE